MNLLILQPIRPNHPAALRAIAAALLARLVLPDGWTAEVRQDDTPVAPPPSPSIYAKHAAVRNHMLDTYLRPAHDRVLWVDSDLVDYPADLVPRLHAIAPDGIAAPWVELDRYPGRFYDIGGFIERGRRFGVAPPHCVQPGDVVNLDSVGCVYLAPAALYHDGVRYAPPPTDYYVEHWSAMQAARQRGIPVRATRALTARHAFLPDFGLPLN